MYLILEAINYYYYYVSRWRRGEGKPNVDVLFDALFWFITTSYTTFLGQNEPLRIKKSRFGPK